MFWQKYVFWKKSLDSDTVLTWAAASLEVLCLFETLISDVCKIKLYLPQIVAGNSKQVRGCKHVPPCLAHISNL